MLLNLEEGRFSGVFSKTLDEGDDDDDDDDDDDNETADVDSSEEESRGDTSFPATAPAALLFLDDPRRPDIMNFSLLVGLEFARLHSRDESTGSLSFVH